MSANDQSLPVKSRAGRASSLGLLLRDYWALTKPEISFLVTISAGAGFLLGVTGSLPITTLLYTLVGTFLCAGGVGVLNHYLEQDLDAQMKRTARRPLPAGRVAPRAARLFGISLVVAGVALLCPLVNALTSILAALTAVLYLFVYTPLKQKTIYNTLVGTLPGALPALGGWAAATGNLQAGGWTIFAILLTWQMPHFLSLGWMYRKDYGRAGFVMLPTVEAESGHRTARQILFFTVLLFGASLTPTLAGVAGWTYLAGAIPLGIWFLAGAWTFYRVRTNQAARNVLKISIFYIPLLLSAIFVDWLV